MQFIMAARIDRYCLLDDIENSTKTYSKNYAYIPAVPSAGTYQLGINQPIADVKPAFFTLIGTQ